MKAGAFQHALIASALQVCVCVCVSAAPMRGLTPPSLSTAALKHTRHKDQHAYMSKYDKSVVKMYCG